MDLRRASRPMCVLLLLIGAVWTTAPHAAENPPVPAPQLNANLITLVGNARFSIFEGDGDEITFVVTTAALGERRYQLEDLPGGVLFVEDPNLVGWTVRVLTSIGIDEDDCLDPAHPCLPADVEVDRVGANRYELRLEEEVDGGIVDDVIMLLETGATPGPAAPLLLPPPNAAHATFVCLGDKCLYTYGQLTTIDREPLAEYIGLESPGNFVGGKREVSSFLAMSEELGPGAIIGPFDPCPIFQTPADPFSPTGLSFLAGLNAPKHCGSTGAVTGGAYAVSDFGKLKAYASLTAEQYPLLPQPAAGVGFRIYSNAGVADVLLFDDDTRLPGNVINRTVRYTFRVDGEVARAGAGAFTDGGFFLRGSQSPCEPFTECFASFGRWHLPGPGAVQKFQVNLPYTAGTAYLTAFELVAAGLVASDPQAGAANLTASVVANFSATATLERIQLFEGAPENLGPEITDFTIVSRSGVDYNQYIESAAPPVICDTDQDRDVDLVDLQRIRAANRMAADEDDPRDGNGDGRINVADVRFCQLRLTPSQ